MMKDHSKKPAESYSSIFAFIYMINGIVGQAIILLPKLVSRTGLLLSTLVLTCIAGVNFITGTHVIEAMGIANACYRLEIRRRKSETKELNSLPRHSDLRGIKAVENSVEEEQTPLVQSSGYEDEKNTSSSDDIKLLPEDYEITEKFEMGAMANMFFTPVGIVLYYSVICFYATGTMASMLVVIVKTLVVLVCTDSKIHVAKNTTNGMPPDNYSPGQFLPHSLCFGDITQQEAYYIILAICGVLFCPWVFFKFTASKYLQFMTVTMKTIAYGFMLGICTAMLVIGQRANPSPPLTGFSVLPALFGIGTYSFKCQFRLPGVIMPIKQKHRILLMMFTALLITLAFHLLIPSTAVFWLSFDELQDLYTLNFFTPFSMSYPLGKKVLSIIGYYIVIYPVFALSPMIVVVAIVIRENLKALVRLLYEEKWIKIKHLMLTIDHILLPSIVVIVPLTVAFSTVNIDFLLSITGGVFGVWIQYLVSTALLFAGKRFLMKKYKGKYENKYKSLFSQIFFLFFIIVWTVVSVILVIIGHILNFV